MKEEKGKKGKVKKLIIETNTKFNFCRGIRGRLLLAIVLIAVYTTSGKAQATVNTTASVTILTPVSISQKQPMHFGTIGVSEEMGGTVVITSAGERTSIGGVSLSDQDSLYSPATSTFTGEPKWMLIILGFLMAFGITWFTIPSIVNISKAKGLYDTPNGRTSHSNSTPTLGGISVFVGIVLSTVIFAGTYFKFELSYIISGLIIVFFIGIKDDILIIAPLKKFAGQILAAVLIPVYADIRITNLYGLFNIEQLPYIVSILLTIFVFLVIINGFNLIDGIDGLAAGIGIITSSIFGIWFWINGNIGYTVLSFSFAGSLLAFFYFNVFSKKNKLFLGDTGSLVTGFVLGVLACRFLQLDLISTGVGYIQSAPAVVFGILVVPLFDTLRVFMLRILKGKSPFVADHQHIHHRLLQLGITHLQVTLILISANLIFVVLCYLLQGIGIIWLTSLILGLASMMSYILVILAKKSTTKVIHSEYPVEGTRTRRIKNKGIVRTRHINNITVHYPEKVNADKE